VETRLTTRSVSTGSNGMGCIVSGAVRKEIEPISTV
jgi:hypothetical protein